MKKLWECEYKTFARRLQLLEVEGNGGPELAFRVTFFDSDGKRNSIWFEVPDREGLARALEEA